MTIPACVGVIMDGNRRWARAHSLSPVEGHQKGYETFISFLGWARDADVQHVIVYAFSTENWKRAEHEVAYLMSLMRTGIVERIAAIEKEQVRIQFIGERSRFPTDIQEKMNEAEERSSQYARTLGIALSYGGRAEILHAVKRTVEEGRRDIDEQSFAQHLWTAGIPDPDLIIRTGGEKRLSNFLLWQAAYAELYFTDTLWPDFSREEFLQALQAVKETKRNGGV